MDGGVRLAPDGRAVVRSAKRTHAGRALYRAHAEIRAHRLPRDRLRGPRRCGRRGGMAAPRGGLFEAQLSRQSLAHRLDLRSHLGGGGKKSACAASLGGARRKLTRAPATLFGVEAMPRLFTGLELPESVAGAVALSRGGVPGARWIEPEDYHITLRFIGEVGLPFAREIAEALSEVRRAPILVRFNGLGWLGGDKPRALVAQVKADAELIELQAEHERRMRRIGLAPETRKFKPHVTLARLRGVRPAAVADYLSSRGRLEVEAFTAERFVLYSSKEGGGGPYVVEAAYPLE